MTPCDLNSCMGLSFSKWLIIAEVFRLDHGHVLTMNEAMDFSAHPVDFNDPVNVAQKRLQTIKGEYKPGPHPKDIDAVAAAVMGLKPAAIVRYDHHPESPAAAIVTDQLKKMNGSGVQAELLKHGIKTRPDFHMIHMNLPGYATANIIVGGKEAVEELWTTLKCQYLLDFVSSKDNPGVEKVHDMMQGKCSAFCGLGDAGMRCKPIHKRIGELLGYTDQQVSDFINKAMDQTTSYNHMPDIEYPFELPPALAKLPKRKGFLPTEALKVTSSLRPSRFDL